MDSALPCPLRCQPICDGLLRGDGVHAVELAGVDQHAGFGVRHGCLSCAFWWGDDSFDRQIVLLREDEVPRIVRRNAHDRAGAVLGQYVIGDEDRDARPAWQHCVSPGGDAIGFAGMPFQIGAVFGLPDVGANGLTVFWRADALGQRVLRCQCHERHAEEGVGAGGEDGDLGIGWLVIDDWVLVCIPILDFRLWTFDCNSNFHSLTPPDPCRCRQIAGQSRRSGRRTLLGVGGDAYFHCLRRRTTGL